MQEKRLRKEDYLIKELEKLETINVFGKDDSSVVLLCWGSNKGVCIEAANNLGVKVIQPKVLWPFPVKEFRELLKGVRNLICVENNSYGQLANLISRFGFKVDKKISKYDGRPFTVGELEEEVKKVIHE
jgi:2-oxoglutarate ferredoxin oxidoreductase subunit alpha